MTDTPILPLGQSGFPYLRESRAIYVDKTDLIYRLACVPAKVFLARPRRFGKSLLVSTFESLFRYGLRDFQGLAIEKRWKDKTYDVVRLDFSAVRDFSGIGDFVSRFQQLIAGAFERVGFTYKREGDFFLVLGRWLEAKESGSLVVLVAQGY